jgi:hypothetical protein
MCFTSLATQCRLEEVQCADVCAVRRALQRALSFSYTALRRAECWIKINTKIDGVVNIPSIERKASVCVCVSEWVNPFLARLPRRCSVSTTYHWNCNKNACRLRLQGRCGEAYRRSRKDFLSSPEIIKLSWIERTPKVPVLNQAQHHRIKMWACSYQIRHVVTDHSERPAAPPPLHLTPRRPDSTHCVGRSG